MSMLPMAATTSAIKRPSHILRNVCKLANNGERMCTRYGLAVQSLSHVVAHLAAQQLDRHVHFTFRHSESLGHDLEVIR